MENKLKNKIILKVRTGSHLYGLDTKDSDEDFIGVYLNTTEELLGLQTSEIIDNSIVSKHENGKNTNEATDIKYYSLQKFCTLALSNNPTILELLFANDENIVELDEYGAKLIAHRDLFLSQRIKHTYLGYAHSQVAKSQVKSKNLRELINARDVLKKNEYKSNYMLYDLLPTGGLEHTHKEGVEISKNNNCEFINIKTHDNKIKFMLNFNNYPDYLTIADLNFNNQKIKDVLKKIEDRLNRTTNRADGMLEHGLDYKFISHTVRLIKEGEELLKTGNLNFPLKDRELLLDIKLGKYKPTEVMDMIGDIEALKEDWNKYNKLPYSSDFKAVNKMVINIYKDYLKNEI